MKKIHLLFSIAFLLLLFSMMNACKRDGTDCGNNMPKFYATEMYGITHDESFEKITDTTVIRYEDLRIEINFSGKHYSLWRPRFNIFPSAFACDPVPPYSEEIITDIIITANQDYDSLHLAGADLKDLFYVKKYSFDSKFTLEDYLKTEPKVENLQFSLKSAPDTQMKIQLTITYFYDGRLVKILKYDSSAFILSPN
ncbi:MAG TPA: hypothetical protein VLZ75_01795 [Chitinophagales bacterium]|nr:hypothetical protein [Chitinophagales bacterium]